VSTYQGLPEQEAFDIEYWLLEEAKLQRMPKPKGAAGRVALVTGGAGGIGAATAERCCARRLRHAGRHRRRRAGGDTAAALAAASARCGAHGHMDVTRRGAVIAAYADAALEFGGSTSSCPTPASPVSAPIEDTTLALWNRNMDILSTGYFLSAARRSS
jgi:NAD(P)-dependent dehydrogenase (short-subunit alcohol dehydrogenase family)